MRCSRDAAHEVVVAVLSCTTDVLPLCDVVEESVAFFLCGVVLFRIAGLEFT